MEEEKASFERLSDQGLNDDLKYLFEMYGMKIIHAKQIKTHGGSIRVYATRKNNFKINKSVKKILKYEKIS